MEEYSILALPEIREMILRHLDTEERRTAVLVCPSFYEIICSIETNKEIKIVDGNNASRLQIINDKIFESIMTSSRRIRRAGIDIVSLEHANAEEKIAAIAEKFKGQVKKLALKGFTLCSEKSFSTILDAWFDVQELTWWYPYLSIPRILHEERVRFEIQKTFSNLKRLSLCDLDEVAAILEKVPNDSLESFVFESPYGYRHLPTVSEETLQAFLNRQTKIKELEMPSYSNSNFDHLALETLSFFASANRLTAVLKNQLTLRRLFCSYFEKDTFNELQKMQNLESLIALTCDETAAGFDEIEAGELKNLKQLKIPFHPIPRQLSLPNLTKLTMKANWLIPEDFYALNRSAPKLQIVDIIIDNFRIMSAFLKNFPELKAIFVRFTSTEYDNGPIEPFQNLALEEMVVRSKFSKSSEIMSAIINSCSNLKRIWLNGVALSEHQISNLLQNLRHLTHFCCDISIAKTIQLSQQQLLGPKVDDNYQNFKKVSRFHKKQFPIDLKY